MSDKLLMVFMKNPVKGKVKTRLAQSVGNDKALQIYTELLYYTESVAEKIKGIEKAIFYSDFIQKNDLWNVSSCKKYLQQGNDLGERMKNAFAHMFPAGYKKILIIGTDCLELRTEHLENAFKNLDTCDITIGPANDGGYYLLGMKKCHEKLFQNIKWSTNTVLCDTINILRELNLTLQLLPELSDVDSIDDYLLTGKAINY